MDQAQAANLSSRAWVIVMNKVVEAQTNAMRSATLALDDNLAKEITRAVCGAMRETFGVEVVPGAPETGEGMVSLVGDVSGVIGMVQAHLEGTLTLCLTFETVRDILP